LALSLNINKDAVLETLEKKKDPIFLGILVVTLLVGIWYLYSLSAKTVEEIIAETTQGSDRNTQTQVADLAAPDEVVGGLLARRSHDMYNIKRNPFGSPQDQLRMRQEVEKAYQKGVDLFQSAQFEPAIQQFDRVIALDVTETRIKYDVLPSEYKRRCQRENARVNLDSILRSANNDIGEGDRLAAANNVAQAESIYKRANDNLNAVINSDPQGDAIGKENLKKVTDLQQQVFNKFLAVHLKSLRSDIRKSVGNAQTLLAGNDLIALLKSMFNLNRIQTSLNELGPSADQINMNERNQLAPLIQQIQKKLSDNYTNLVTQANTLFTQAVSDQDIQQSREAISIMQMALNTKPGDQELQKMIGNCMIQRANLLIQVTDDFIAQQNDILKNNQFDQFDARTKVQLLEELAIVKQVGATTLTSTLRASLTTRENNLKALRKPPKVTQDYQVLSIRSSSNSRWRIEILDKTSRTGGQKRVLNLAINGKDNRTKITLKQVDTTGGFVILSKPGYQDAQVQISAKN